MSFRIIGLTLSAHVFAMYAFAPVFGRVCERLGTAPSIRIGLALLVAAAGGGLLVERGNLVEMIVALLLLGLGWSLTLVATSTAQVGSATRREQGRGDLMLNGAGAVSALLGGAVVSAVGFGGLCLALAVIVLAAFALAQRRLRWALT